MKIKPSKVLMIRPIRFGYNEQTAKTNSFQQTTSKEASDTIQKQALIEFDELVNKLEAAKIGVIIFEDAVSPTTPDSIFPNNWISFHENNTIVLYPMMAENRRMERRKDIINHFRNDETQIIDLSHFENEARYLEGTGSIVFDYENKIAYANISARTNLNILELLCEQLNYSIITFQATDSNKKDIYHTNVLMCVGNTFAVICEECITDKKQLKVILNSFTRTNHEVISIDYNQLNSFAGNMYQLFNRDGKSYILFSRQAYESLNKNQLMQLKKHGELLYSPLETIEKYGGGSARCMIADIKC